MSKWRGKYVIGLTGNIGVGKSVVRRMLEHLGAYGIDADALSHRAIAKGAPGYDPVVEAFGRWILDSDGQVNRQKLARVVFVEPAAMIALENIVHPLVESAIDIIVRRATQSVVVIEAIKLLESGLAKACDTIWVVTSPSEVQVNRLVNLRHMAEEEAHQRIAAQPSPESKLAAAQVVIDNVGSFEDTWQQVVTAWKGHVKVAPMETLAVPTKVPASAKSTAQLAPTKVLEGELNIKRGKPANAAEIADILNRFHGGDKLLTQEDIMAAFGEKAFLMLQVGETAVGIIGWQVENLVARTTDIAMDPALVPEKALPLMINSMEKASKDLQCEASLVFVSPELAKQEQVWHSLGYERCTPQTLTVQAWQEAANESMPTDSVLMFKQLRAERVLRPI
ncbi:MAG TPA: dephospho-CoA kinase [Longilinea sp.]|nr:dephospho-CoA kinase [Longilinea sp.]